MFTGIVEEIGHVEHIVIGSTVSQLTIAARTVLLGSKVGDSIGADGVCVTVARLTATSFTCDLMPETLRRSTLHRLRSGMPINLERAVAYGGRVGGHYVQGHIDGTGAIRSLTGDGPAIIVRISADQGLLRYVVPKGFVAVDGASLTVVDVGTDTFSVSLVYHTQQNITLPGRRAGDQVNIEVDILGKYVERLMQPLPERRHGVTEELLARHGYS